MNHHAVELKGVTLTYGPFIAVKNVDLSIAKGSFVTLLGPSGCGKTTILRSIAGLVTPEKGEITVAGRRINDVPIHERNIGLVFQNYALFPHKTVFDNVAFGLKYRKVAKPEIARKVKKALDMVRLPGVEKKLPSELSGGQQQRIALARAIVIEPDVLLLDEPLSALDANLREEMRTELKIIQREVGITTIFVTHDQEEALAMSDDIVVMNHGVIEQKGSPEEVYRTPRSRFVASFLGQSNLLPGEVKSIADGMARIALQNGLLLSAAAPASLKPHSKVTVVIRAQRVGVERPEATGDNQLTGRIASTSYLGGSAVYMIDCNGLTLQAIAMIEDKVFREGDEVRIAITLADCVLLDERGFRFDPVSSAA
jgi:ABC-type Fe3+/spermidine/putrescine transport system ATPase subunit